MFINCKKGFTLLELLVVVVIIGILAAIALPQYQLAVDKAEFAKYQSMVSSLRDAYDDYVLANNKGTKHFEDLSFTLPSTFQDYTSSYYFDCKADSNMYCCMRDYFYEEGNSWYASIFCGKKDEENSIIYNEYLYSTKGNSLREKYCLAKKENKRANKVCNAIGSDKEKVNFANPSEIRPEYYRYKIN